MATVRPVEREAPGGAWPRGDAGALAAAVGHNGALETPAWHRIGRPIG
jgi:hypothetical protein